MFYLVQTVHPLILHIALTDYPPYTDMATWYTPHKEAMNVQPIVPDMAILSSQKLIQDRCLKLSTSSCSAKDNTINIQFPNNIDII